MNCGLGGNIAILRCSLSSWQPRAGTAACDCLGDSLHRVPIKKKKMCFKGRGQDKGKESYGSVKRYGVEGEGEGQALSRSLSCCNLCCICRVLNSALIV